MLEFRTLAISEKALLIPFARKPMPLIAPNAMRATTSAYSTKSCPSSSLMNCCKYNIVRIKRVFIVEAPNEYFLPLVWLYCQVLKAFSE
jgi:hypothetical protein